MPECSRRQENLCGSRRLTLLRQPTKSASNLPYIGAPSDGRGHSLGISLETMSGSSSTGHHSRIARSSRRPVGGLCVLDEEARTWSPSQRVYKEVEFVNQPIGEELPDQGAAPAHIEAPVVVVLDSLDDRRVIAADDPRVSPCGLD